MMMHHIALFTPCIALFDCGHLLHIWVDHAEPESKFQAEQVQWAFGDSLASSGGDTNLDWIKASPSAFNHNLLIFYNFTLIMILAWALSCKS
jgi:hypothetical protein